MNIGTGLNVLLRKKPCLVHGSDMRVKVEASGRYVYPDATVVCGKPQFEDETRDTLLNPQVIVEVLSDSTEAYDRGEKFAQYRSVASVMDYVLVSQKRVRVEHFQRQPDGRWVLAVLGPGQSLTLESVGVELPVDEIYLKVFPEPAP